MTGNFTAVILKDSWGARGSSDSRIVEGRKGRFGRFLGCLVSWGYFASKLLSPPVAPCYQSRPHTVGGVCRAAAAWGVCPGEGSGGLWVSIR